MKFIQKYPRQTGRTTLALMDMLMYALHNDNVKCMYVTHNHIFSKNCADKVWSVVSYLHVGIRNTSAKISLVNGSVIEFIGDETPIGRSDFDWISYDHVV